MDVCVCVCVCITYGNTPWIIVQALVSLPASLSLSLSLPPSFSLSYLSRVCNRERGRVRKAEVSCSSDLVRQTHSRSLVHKRERQRPLRLGLNHRCIVKGVNIPLDIGVSHFLCFLRGRPFPSCMHACMHVCVCVCAFVSVMI